MPRLTKVMDAILSLNPSANVSLSNDDLDTCEILWMNDTPAISKEDIKTEMDRLEVEWNSLVYARAREGNYPVTKEFIEAYTEKEILDDSTKWDLYVTKYNKVRTDHPKE